MKTVRVDTKPGYSVMIGPGLIERCGEYIGGARPPCTAVLVTDSGAGPLYAGRAARSLETAGFKVAAFSLPAGEGSKSLAEYGRLLGFMADNGVTRSDVIVALGGGVVGDLAGFAAATYQRGIALVQLATTLLAQIDSSVGGKTAVDLPQGKNLAGAFWQPELVLCDTGCLDTLPPGAKADGLAEMIKYGMIADAALLRRLRAGAPDDDMEGAVARCVQIKAEIVAADERDNGRRQLLNFGHTVGHAIERHSRYAVSHGRAVAMGMALTARAAVRRGAAPPGVYQSLKEALDKNGLPEHCGIPAAVLAREALVDKKRRGDRITLALPVKEGECGLFAMRVGELEAFFEDGA